MTFVDAVHYKLVLSVAVAMSSLGALLLTPDSTYYPSLSAGTNSLVAANGARALEWEKNISILLDTARTRLELIKALKDTTTSDCDRVSSSKRCVKAQEARLDALTALLQAQKEIKDWESNGGAVAIHIKQASAELQQMANSLESP